MFWVLIETIILSTHNIYFEVQWLSGRVLDSIPRDRGLEPNQCHSVVSLSETHLSLLSTGSTQEDLSRHN